MKLFLAAMGGGLSAPNLLTFLYRYFADSKWAAVLHAWEDVFFSILIASFISLLFYLGSRKKQWIPSGLQNFLEWAVENFRNVVVGILGPYGEQFVPFLGTLFIYILFMNLAGLIPFLKSPSSNLNITIALALCVFFRVQYLNIKNMGVGGFFYHLLGSPKGLMGWLMAPLMFPIELITQIARPVTLALRLFGNILGEKILVNFFAVVGITVLYFFPIQTPFMLLGVLTGLMQAMVFTLLSTIYILLSVPHTEEHNMNH